METRSAETSYQVPLPVVGSSRFGRYPKISLEKTFNMFVADDAMINMPGYQWRVALLGNGRGLFSSKKAGKMFAVSERNVYSLNTALLPVLIATLQSITGDVFIDEDIISNIAFCDGVNVYIYNYVDDIFYTAGTNPYNDGTAAQSGNTVTGTLTTFTSDMVGGTIYWPDKTSATITQYNSATSLTVNTSATHVDGAYLIVMPLDFVPSYVFFHDGRFISPSPSSGGVQISQWCLSQSYNVTGGATYIVFPNDAQHRGAFQTKPDLPIAGARLPGRSSTIFIMGSQVTEQWTDLGLALFPYVKNTSFNVDFGCINPATISTLNNLVVWTGINERSGPVIMYTTGQDVQNISTDGIDYLFENLKFPEQCYGYTFMISGHLFYVITFYNAADNLTLAYDFKTEKFYNLSDENYNYFIAKKVVFFNNKYYFISINDGDIYELNSSFDSYEYANGVVKEIPRSRVLPTFSTENGVPHILNDMFFTMEQGVDPEYTGQGDNIASISIISGGSGYTTATVLIEGDGDGAYATATITGGVITSINLQDAGVGYSWAVVTIIGDGTGANCEAKLNVSNYVPRVDMSISYDGAYTWSAFTPIEVNTYGRYKNRFYANNLGYSSEFTLQYRFYTKNRVVYKNGMMSLYR